ncbi:cysteine desulfurase family protein [Sinosporangium siamense]|uniref:cysteine desulfurase n=1 Tax=Sinosporangium siamense TaxID=1367973 RepID=A0A919RNE6_9ACTN|nr:cysteine desulfurase family protein [Sinosporangium siamense]GII96985.1 cysteine desulfurase [Sinosporangium siamense]
MTARPIYLDHQATTPLDERVLEAMLPYFTTEFGNPAGRHAYGHTAAAAVRTARRRVAELVGAEAEREIVFTSGATEANHLAIVGAALAVRPYGGHIVTTVIEHKAVLAACDRLAERHGYKVTRVGVDGFGRVDPAAVAAALTPNTVLVSVMHANNEIGTLQPLAAVAEELAGRGVLLHTDAAQSAGWGLLDVGVAGVDLVSLTAHKFYGPKGVGALYVRAGTPLLAQQTGGGQEHGLRAGTPNVPAIVGLGTAAHLVPCDTTPVPILRDRLQKRLLAALPGAVVNGHPEHRLGGNLSLTVPGLRAADLLARLPGVAASAGAACDADRGEPSHVLSAIGLSRAEAQATVRLSLGRTTTAGEVDRAAELLADAASRVRRPPP